MKIFKIYSQIDEYVVLKCPYCGREFRAHPQDKVFGKERKNAKCQKCEKLFNFQENQLDEDPLPKMWNYIDENKEMIMIKPNKEQVFFKREEFKAPDFTSADNFSKENN